MPQRTSSTQDLAVAVQAHSPSDTEVGLFATIAELLWTKPYYATMLKANTRGWKRQLALALDVEECELDSCLRVYGMERIEMLIAGNPCGMVPVVAQETLQMGPNTNTCGSCHCGTGTCGSCLHGTGTCGSCACWEADALHGSQLHL